MKCLDNGIIQAYIDGETDIELKKNIEIHLGFCTECNDMYKNLIANDDFSFEKINKYKQYFNENIKPVQKPLKQECASVNKERGLTNYMLKYKKLIAAACLIFVTITCISVQPIRAAISDALSIFRVENIKGIKVSLADINKIRLELQQKNPNINIENFGKITTKGGEEKNISIEEAKNLTDFKVKFPTTFGSLVPTINSISPSSIDFTLNVKNVNEILKTFGATKLFPLETDGKTFTANFNRIITENYIVGENNYTVTASTSPQLSVPEGVNVDDLYNSVIELPILPDGLKAKLQSITDWKSTLYIPVIDSKMEAITINSKEAYVYSNINLKTSTTASWLIFMENGYVYGIQSNTSKDDIIRVAQSMR